MSRIGKMPIHLPAGVEVKISSDNIITVKGPKGELTQQVAPSITVKQEDGVLHFERPSDSKEHKAMHGLYRALVANMVKGVSEGFTKKLEINGVGYRAALQGNKLVISAGYSHNVEFDIPAGLKVVLPKNTNIEISGIDKQLVGQFAAEIRDVRKPEPYKGKGIKYDYEVIRRKEGKTAKK